MPNITNLDRDFLLRACQKVVKSSLRQPSKPTHINDVIDTDQIKRLTKMYFEEALQHVEFIQDQGRDPNMIARAVIYLAESQAIPPMKEDLMWFSNMLQALLELACPNIIITKDAQQFFEDIKSGIEIAKLDTQ